MTNKTKPFLTALLTANIFFSCNKEDDRYLFYNDFQTFSILETLTTDNYLEKTERTEAYTFINSQLQYSTITQVLPYYDHTMECQDNASYAGANTTITGCSVESAVYTLNREGFAVSCDIKDGGQLRHYDFSYTNGYLSAVSEAINNTETFQMELRYNKGDLIQTTEKKTGYDTHTLNFTPTAEENVGKLPLHYLTEIYPLSFHRIAIYAGILGKAPQHLIQQITSESSIPDTAKYSYKFSNEYIISCRIEIKGDGWISSRSLRFHYE